MAALKEWDRKKQLDGKNMAAADPSTGNQPCRWKAGFLARRKVLILLEPFLHTDTASRSVLQSALPGSLGARRCHSGDFLQPDIVPRHFGTRYRCRAVGTMVRSGLGCSGGVPR